MSERVLLETHAHTKEVSPCGWLPASALVEALVEAGYGAVVITDHYLPGERESRQAREDFLAGFRAAREAAGDRLVVLPGMEIRFKDRVEDYLVYGMTEEDILGLPDDVCGQGLSTFHNEIAAPAGWAVYQAHPFRKGHFAANPAFLEGMETFNGNPRHNSQNRLATNFATLNSLRTIAGTDVHRPGDVGIVGLLVPPDALTPQGLATWLKATPHPRVQYQEAPANGIRYLVGALPGQAMLAALYTDAGWTSYTRNMDESLKGLRNSARLVTAWDDTALVGLARAVGDGYTVLYVQDILVLGTYHRRGIGRELMRRLLLPYRNVRQTVLITDDTAQTYGFFTACGFENVGEYASTGYLRLRG